MIEISKNQYWIVIGIAFIFLCVNGYLVLKLVNNEVEFDRTCPVPKDKINGCECAYDPLFRDKLKYCTCWPGNAPNYSEFSNPDNLLVIPRVNLSNYLPDGTTGN